MLYPFSINCVVSIDKVESGPLHVWRGTGINDDGRKAQSTTFRLDQGVVSLQSVASDAASSFDCDFPVGHALAKMLVMGDRLNVSRNASDGGWTYWLLRDNHLVIGVGYLSGCYGGQVDIIWDRLGKRKGSPSADPSYVRLRLDQETFELKEKEEITFGNHYAKCIKFGVMWVIPAQYPSIAIIRAEDRQLRETFASYLAFEERLCKTYIEMSQKLFPSGENE